MSGEVNKITWEKITGLTNKSGNIKKCDLGEDLTPFSQRIQPLPTPSAPRPGSRQPVPFPVDLGVLIPVFGRLLLLSTARSPGQLFTSTDTAAATEPWEPSGG